MSEEQRRLVSVVRSTSQLKVRRSRGPSSRVRLDVVILERRNDHRKASCGSRGLDSVVCGAFGEMQHARVQNVNSDEHPSPRYSRRASSSMSERMRAAVAQRSDAASPLHLDKQLIVGKFSEGRARSSHMPLVAR